MKTERMAGPVRLLMFLILAPALFLAATGCGGGYSSGSGGGGGGGGQSPTITSLNPTSGPAGTAVTISGNYFGATQGSSTVTFNGTASTPTSWGNTIIDVPVPAGATSGNVVVTVGGVASNGVTFTVSSSGGGSSAGWTWIQDSNLIFCQGANRMSCNPGLGNITPTVAGSVWILQTQSPGNVSISSINPGNGGGMWIHCVPCHVTNPSGFTADVWYNLTGNAGFDGANPFGFTLTGSAGAFFGANFVELLPPPGSTASLDVVGTATPAACTACPGPTLNLTATDAVWMNPGGAAAASWNSSGPAPFQTDYNGGSFALNVGPGTVTPTITYGPPAANVELVALAFKSTAGTFAAPPKQYTVANFQAFVPNTACSTSCVVPIPATTAGNLLVVEAANEVGNFISSISGGGTWVVPTQCQAKQVVQGTNNTISCAYNLNVAGGVTSLDVTMQGGSASHGFAVTEFATNGGKWSLDAIGATLNTPNALCSGFCYPGQPLTLTGQNDVVVQASWDVGESEGANYYPLPAVPTTSQGAQGPGPANTFFAQNASIAILTDTGPTAPTPTWLNAVPNQNTFATGLAFKAQ